MNTPTIIFIGFRGTGKSTISTQLSEILGLQRFSTDQRVVERLGMSIASFVAQSGWAEFRRIEHEEIQALQKTLQGKTASIIDCGGGVVENPENMRLLGELGKIVWIDATLEDVISRLMQNEADEQRPLLTQGDMRTDLETNYTRRRPIYQQYAELYVNTSLHSLEQCLQQIQLFLQKKP